MESLSWLVLGFISPCSSAHSCSTGRRNTQGKAAFSIHSLVRGLAFAWVYKSTRSILSFQFNNVFIFYVIFCFDKEYCSVYLIKHAAWNESHFHIILIFSYPIIYRCYLSFFSSLFLEKGKVKIVDGLNK